LKKKYIKKWTWCQNGNSTLIFKIFIGQHI